MTARLVDDTTARAKCFARAMFNRLAKSSLSGIAQIKIIPNRGAENTVAVCHFPSNFY